ncbi:MAG: formylglycine-generating enzyme family protein [Magnetococcales bacterium]|nr:formylglycine-generating enzyme family protein [Magnetococcales bacterium]
MSWIGLVMAEERNSIGMVLVLIPPGSFVMGADRTMDERVVETETPRHKVIIGQGFYLGKYEVTQAQWQAVMGSNRSEFPGRDLPVENVSWEDVQEFIQKLNRLEKTDLYRLPTEAEWEYAARAGTETVRYWGNGMEEMERYAWFGYDQGNAYRQTHPVGQLQPNGWGLHDMLGNVWEWVADWHGERYYQVSPEVDPKGPDKGVSRVVRGGSWNNGGESLRISNRHDYHHEYRNSAVGFRLARTPAAGTVR